MKKSIRVPYALAVYGKDEINAVNKLLERGGNIAAGELVRQFEKKMAKLFGKKYAVMVNSGSSANLLALEILNLPEGSEVITPALTFATTLAPILQKRLVPIFADVKEGSYLIDVDKIEGLITKKTCALMIPSLIGNVPDMEKLRDIAKRHKLWFIEDSCDTSGATFQKRPTGVYSDVTTTSFYGSHIITSAGVGGMVLLHDEDLAKRARIMSNWGRESVLFGPYEKSEKNLRYRFARSLAGVKYDAKFIFSEVGYNFQLTEIHAVFALKQLKKLPHFSGLRQKHFRSLNDFFKKYERLFVLPVQDSRVFTNWLAFPLTIRKGAGFSRYDLVTYLEKNNIQTRPVFTGNVLRQPAFRKAALPNSENDFPEADNIMRNGFLIGCHHGLMDKHIDYLKQVFGKFLNKYI